ncbi:MAG TPA: penicillin-binding transpeptidase domain-containing protein [Acidimicrobiales bacterium]|nr:penicillin-binding transpeptidase domain-containing protein [Acidimicrobiales bacterium]
MDRQIRKLAVVLIVMFFILFAKLNDLQVVRADKLATAPGNTRAIVRDFSRERGVIQTADGAIVAQSVPSNDDFERLRQYPEGALFAHVGGYFSFTYGTEGVERTFNADLAGRSVGLKKLTDLVTDRTRTGNVTLTLSKALQQVARDALGNRTGAVVALNPTDGAVLAMWSNPSFDPNPLAAHDQKAVQAAWTSLQDDPGKPLLPRAYRRSYAPGSTFKVVTAAATLERHPELATKPYPVLRDLDLPQTDANLPNFGKSACGGTLPDLLRVSCNTGFAQLGLDMGAEALAGEAGDFGFNTKPPLDLPAVARSTFPDVAAFRQDQPALAKSAIGQQDVAATPLQMALVAAGVANGGVIMKPHVLAEVRDSEGELVRSAQPAQWMKAMEPQNAAALRDMMITVVNNGTAGRAAVPGVQVAAKTGTAQTVGDNSHAWLIAFAPAEQPRVAVAVIVESQPGLGDTVTGGRIAAPIAQAVLKAALGTS